MSVRSACVVAALVLAFLSGCGGGAVASPSPATSPTPDAATQRYVALIEGYWDGIQAADVVQGNTNVAARTCLGNASPTAKTDISLIDPKVCAERANALVAVHQKFLSDLDTTPAPARFAADDHVFRT